MRYTLTSRSTSTPAAAARRARISSAPRAARWTVTIVPRSVCSPRASTTIGTLPSRVSALRTSSTRQSRARTSNTGAASSRSMRTTCGIGGRKLAISSPQSAGANTLTAIMATLTIIDRLRASSRARACTRRASHRRARRTRPWLARARAATSIDPQQEGGREAARAGDVAAIEHLARRVEDILRPRRDQLARARAVRGRLRVRRDRVSFAALVRLVLSGRLAWRRRCGSLDRMHRGARTFCSGALK